MSAALADNTVDPDIGASDVSVYEVDQIAAVSCVHMATASLTAGRAFLPLHAETGHSSVVNDHAGIFYKKQLAIQFVLSYHSNVPMRRRSRALVIAMRGRTWLARLGFFLFFMRQSVLYTIADWSASLIEKNVPSYTTRYHRYIYQIQILICGKLAVGGNHTTPRNTGFLK